MKKSSVISVLVLLITLVCTGCGEKEPPKIGVAFGVGPAARWAQEQAYMVDYAKTLGISLEARLNTNEEEKPLATDCYELIDSGIDVLIIRPRNVTALTEVIAYAHEHGVKVISYDSLIENEQIDLFVGYDSVNTGESIAQYLSEIAPTGNYLFLWGDSNKNIDDMYLGSMKYLNPADGQITILKEATIPGWSPEEAKKVVKETVMANDNNIDGIFAFSDKLAGAAAEAIAELGITTPVAIGGMDAELDAVKRIIDGTQSCTAYMDLKALSYTAIDQAINLANGDKLEYNSEIDNKSDAPIPSYLLTRQIITNLNIDRVLIETGYYTKEEVYGKNESAE